MKFNIIAASVLSITLLVGFGQADKVYAERSIESVNQDISTVEKDIIDTVIKVNSINKEIEGIQSIIDKNDKEVKSKEEQISDFNKEIELLKEEIKSIEEEIKKRHDILKDRLIAYQRVGGDVSYLEVIFGSSSFESFISRFAAVKTITKADNDLVEAQEDSMKEVEDKEKLISTNLKESEKAKEDLVKISEDSKQKKSSLAQTKTNVDSEKKALEVKKTAYIKEGNDIKVLEEKARIDLVNKKAEESKLATISKQKADNEAKLKTNPAQTNSSSQSSTSKPSNSKPTSAPSTSGKTFTMQATAYTAECYGCSGITATGINLNNNRHMKVVAVDPRVIPLGSRVWVSGYGEAIAGDTGGAIKGNRIDLHFPTKNSAYAFGRKSVTVKMLN